MAYIDTAHPDKHSYVVFFYLTAINVYFLTMQHLGFVSKKIKCSHF